MALMMPRFDWKPVEKVQQASLCKNFASSSSSSRCSFSVPFRKREPLQPVPYCSSALRPASCTSGHTVRPR